MTCASVSTSPSWAHLASSALSRLFIVSRSWRNHTPQKNARDGLRPTRTYRSRRILDSVDQHSPPNSQIEFLAGRQSDPQEKFLALSRLDDVDLHLAGNGG